MDNETRRFKLPHLEQQAAEHQARTSDQQSQEVEAKRKEEERQKQRLEDHKFLAHSNAVEVLKEAARLLNVAGKSSSLSLTDIEHVEERHVDPTIVLAWGLISRDEPGSGSDSFPTTYYSFDRISCKAGGAGEIVVVCQPGERVVRDGAIEKLASTIENAIRTPEYVTNSGHPASNGTSIPR